MRITSPHGDERRHSRRSLRKLGYVRRVSNHAGRWKDGSVQVVRGTLAFKRPQDHRATASPLPCLAKKGHCFWQFLREILPHTSQR
jgi:hypothetical protein